MYSFALEGSNPALFLEGKRPHLIDEWQKYPEVWDAAKTSVDKENNGNLYILTGFQCSRKRNNRPHGQPANRQSDDVHSFF